MKICIEVVFVSAASVAPPMMLNSFFLFLLSHQIFSPSECSAFVDAP